MFKHNAFRVQFWLPALVLGLGVPVAHAASVQTTAEDAYRMVPEWDSLLPSEPKLPEKVCATLKAELNTIGRCMAHFYNPKGYRIDTLESP